MSLTYEDLTSLLDYDSRSGKFYWWERPYRSSVAAGDEAGYLDSYGRRVITVKGTRYFAHRLAWLYVHGEMPPHDIKHKNNKFADNQFNNLVCVERKNNLGVPGVTKHRGRFRAYIRQNGKKHHLGSFKTLEEAGSAYARAQQFKAEMHP